MHPQLGIARVMEVRAMPLNNEHLFLISPELGDQFCHAPRVAAITRLETWIAACRVYVTSAH
jgi:hypothetical protein